MVGCVEGILGIRPDFDGLLLSPSIPSTWREVKITKMFRNKKLNITVQNLDSAEGSYRECFLNGTKLSSNYIPANSLSEENEILLVM
jgi:cellobiose phosphorylase